MNPFDRARLLALMLLTMLSFTTAFAVPAKPGQTRYLTLADGSTVNALLVGDEHGHFWQGADGKAYQAVAGSGYFQPVDRRAVIERASVRRAAANSRRVRRLPGRSNVGELSAITGQKKGLIILVNFSDVAFKTADDNVLYQRIANEENFSYGDFKGSMRDYFYDQSQGQFELTFDVVGPVTVSNSQEYYGSNDSDENDEHPAEMVIEALQLADSQVDYADYDWDGDGEVEQVYIVYAGQGEADGGAAETIWPHEWLLAAAAYYGDGSGPQTLDGVKIDTYACGGELDGDGNIAGIGTMCHEFSHCLGYPDFYDTDYSGGQGMGYWDLMDGGSYDGNGYQPAGYTSYERWVAGWETPTELTNTQSISNMEALQNGGGSYIIYNKGNRNEYFLLENRQRVGWDASLPGAGLLILHVDYDADAWTDNKPNDDPSHQRMTWIAADNDYQYVIEEGTKYYTFAGMAGDTYPYGTNNSFSKTSTPAATLYNKNTDGTNYLDSSVESITQNSDGTVSFQFKGLDTAVSDPDTKTFKLVTSTSELQSGLRYVIACGSKAKAAGSLNSTYLSPVDVDIADDIITIGDGSVEVFILEQTGNGWSVKNESTNLFLQATDPKKLSYSSSAYYWTLGNGTAGVIMTYGSYGTIIYNVSSTRFTTYTSDPSTSMIQANLYKEYSDGSTNPGPVVTSFGNVYELVTDATTLAAGDEILLAYVDDETAMAMSATQSTNNRPAVDVTLNSDGTLTPDEEVQVITLEKDGDSFLLDTGDGYLYAASSSKNYLRTETEADDNAKAVIAISEGYATITFQGTNTHNAMRYNPNNGSPIFSCYASTSTVGSLPRLYRRVPDVSVTISKVGYATLYYSDKNLQLPQGVEAFTFTLADGILQQNAVEGIIGKGTAVVLKDTQADNVSSHTYQFAVVNTGTAPAENCLYGYDEAATTSVPDGGDYKYYMLSLNKAGDLSSAGFYYGAPDGGPFLCGAHRAFLALPSSQSSNVVAYLFDGSVSSDDTTTAIRSAGYGRPSTDSVYDLQGRRISGQWSTVDGQWQKGIYIVGGRKVIVK